ncbi:MAG: hypothetical protein WBQ73_01000, partial [Candidatus Babeliales bacterium]
LKVLDDNNYILKSPKPIVRLDSFSEYGYVFLVRGFLSSNYTLDSWDIASDVRISIVQMLNERGMRLAVPTRILVHANQLKHKKNVATNVTHE